MKFSFVLPVYNTEAFLPRCLDSIRCQSGSDFEVIVVDDCSPGGCGETLRPYGDFVRYVRHDRNRGAFQARCTGVSVARGDYIVSVDPDDYLLPGFLKEIRAALAGDSADVVSCWMECDVGGKIYPHWCRRPAGLTSADDTLREIAVHQSNYSIVSKVVRRSVYAEAVSKLAQRGDVYVNTSEDLLATVAILMRANTVLNVAYAGYRYFSNSGSITAGRKDVAGFLRACQQTRLVHDALLDMAARQPSGRECAETVRRIVRLSERWFCSEALDGPVDIMPECLAVLVRVFRPEDVAEELSRAICQIKSSRLYCVCGAISRRLSHLLGRA